MTKNASETGYMGCFVAKRRRSGGKSSDGDRCRQRACSMADRIVLESVDDGESPAKQVVAKVEERKVNE